jgi:hypothetical protein
VNRPPLSPRKLALTLIGLTAAGAGVVLATDEAFRDQVLASAKALGDEIKGGGEESGDLG